MFSGDDTSCMARALLLAERGLMTTAPNPRVGCVLVMNGEIVGEGWHERSGQPHAVFSADGARDARGDDLTHAHAAHDTGVDAPTA